LTQLEGSVTQFDGVTTSVGGEVAPKRGKAGDDLSWADANLSGSKNKENPCS
jgi:hypothetical protein